MTDNGFQLSDGILNENGQIVKTASERRQFRMCWTATFPLAGAYTVAECDSLNEHLLHTLLNKLKYYY